LLAGLCLLAPASAAAAAAVSADPAVLQDAGQRIYREGVLASGRPLLARRENGTQVDGATAACINCHRRSALGNVEGNIVVPPITAKYLFRPSDANAGDLTMAHVEGYHQDHAAFDDTSLARAIREGLVPGGRALSALMPRYALDDASMAQLIAYLRQQTHDHVPGVSDTELQFATIITPDADPVERKAMLDVLERFFATQRDVLAAEVRPMRTTREVSYRVTRRWDLHVWELTGPPEGWEGQLHERMKIDPVFAVISGLGRRTWAPIHRFCESDHVPCLFPNVDLAPVQEGDFYPVYFSRGVLLESDLIGGAVRKRRADGGASRVVQVYRRGDVGEAAAAALGSSLRADGIEVLEQALPAQGGAEDLARGLGDTRAGDSLVLWLRPDDVRALPPQAPPQATVYLSGLMSGLESAPVPQGWRAALHMAYPLDLPQSRLARMNFPYGWFRVQRLPVTAERVQVDTYLTCVIVAEAVGHMFDSFVPEYLVERLEAMVSRRLANAYYPRLGLAPGQRFASKGGYIVHFAAGDGAGAPPATGDRNASPPRPVVAETDWVVP
jgi:hypothetical protein